MKAKTRISALIIAVVLIVGLFAGFSVSAEATELRTVKILAPLNRPNSVHGLEKRDEYPAYQQMSKELAERGLVLDFETVVNEQFEVVLQTRLAAGNDLPDMVAMQNYVTDAAAVTYGQNGLFLDVVEQFKTYDDDGSILKFWEDEFPEIFGFLSTTDGKIFWVPYMYKSKFVTGEDYCGTGFSTSIRKDWMDKLNLTWKPIMTTDEVFDALVAFQENDVNGNGVEDEVIGIPLSNFQNGIAQAFGIPVGIWPGLAGFTERSDDVVCPWYCEGVTDYVNYMKRIVEAGLYDTSMIGAAFNDVSTQQRVENKISLVHSYVAQTWLEGDVTGAEGVVEYAPMFVNKAEGDKDFIVNREGVIMGYTAKYVIPSTCKDVEAVVDLFDYVFRFDYTTLFGFGLEGVSFEYDADGTRRQKWAYADISDDPDRRDVWPALFMGQALPELGVGVFPVDRVVRETTYNGKPVVSKDTVGTWIFDNNHTMWSEHNTPLISMPTPEETEVLNRTESILQTYSEELLIELILGNKPVENLEEYVGEMKALGLDDYLAVFQARHDRFVAATEKE